MWTLLNELPILFCEKIRRMLQEVGTHDVVCTSWNTNVHVTRITFCHGKECLRVPNMSTLLPLKRRGGGWGPTSLPYTIFYHVEPKKGRREMRKIFSKTSRKPHETHFHRSKFRKSGVRKFKIVGAQRVKRKPNFSGYITHVIWHECPKENYFQVGSKNFHFGEGGGELV